MEGTERGGQVCEEGGNLEGRGVVSQGFGEEVWQEEAY